MAPEVKKPRKGVYLLPNMITTLSMFLGFLSMVWAVQGRFESACFAILLSFCPKFACLIGLMPAATIGGVSLILYGMISAVGVRNLVEASVDFSSSRNVFVAALILVVSIGVQYGTNGGVQIGPVAISGLALAALVGIFLNAILPEQLGMKVKSFKGKDKSHLK